MTNYSTGHEAETVAVEYLNNHGYKILDQNWKTRYCEIDVVAEKDKIVYLVEVKFRKSAGYGTGLEYITPKKLKQMTFAADIWINNHIWTGDYRLAALEVSGPGFTVTEFLTDL